MHLQCSYGCDQHLCMAREGDDAEDDGYDQRHLQQPKDDRPGQQEEACSAGRAGHQQGACDGQEQLQGQRHLDVKLKKKVRKLLLPLPDGTFTLINVTNLRKKL